MRSRRVSARLASSTQRTRQLLLLCRGLTDEQLDREFDIGHRTARATLQHIIFNVEVWSDLIVSTLIERLDRAASHLARVARTVSERGGWDERWVDVLDNPPAEKTYGGAIAHVITHSMHHRAQLLYMLRRLEVGGLPEGDVLSWERQTGTA